MATDARGKSFAKSVLDPPPLTQLQAIENEADAIAAGTSDPATASANINALTRQIHRLTRPPLNPKAFGITLGLIVVVVGVVFLGLIPGWTQDIYESMYTNTTGRPWTHVMRDQWWWLPLFASPFIALLAAFLPFRWWARVVLVFGIFFVGYLAGHVFWGEA